MARNIGQPVASQTGLDLNIITHNSIVWIRNRIQIYGILLQLTDPSPEYPLPITMTAAIPGVAQEEEP